MQDQTGTTQDEFHAWAAALRASVEAIQRLDEETEEKERLLAFLLLSNDPDSLPVRRLRAEIAASRREIERLVGALPTLP